MSIANVNDQSKRMLIPTFKTFNLQSPVWLNLDPTTEGYTISMQNQEEIKKVTLTFIMQNKTIFEQLAKL